MKLGIVLPYSGAEVGTAIMQMPARTPAMTAMTAARGFGSRAGPACRWHRSPPVPPGPVRTMPSARPSCADIPVHRFSASEQVHFSRRDLDLAPPPWSSHHNQVVRRMKLNSAPFFSAKLGLPCKPNQCYIRVTCGAFKGEPCHHDRKSQPPLVS